LKIRKARSHWAVWGFFTLGSMTRNVRAKGQAEARLDLGQLGLDLRAVAEVR
jgi:hypothetical protein